MRSPITIIASSLLFSFYFSTAFAQVIDLSSQDINLKVAVTDESDSKGYGWNAAKNTCQSKDMRLPRIEELSQIFCHADLTGSIKDHSRTPQSDPGCKQSKTSSTVPNINKDNYYWSSTAYNMGVSLYLDAYDGHHGYKEHREKMAVRCVH